MAASIIVDASYLVTLLSRRESNHRWAVRLANRHPPPWLTCEAVLSEAFHLLGPDSGPAVTALLQRSALVPSFQLAAEMATVLRLMQKYDDVPMSLADACLVHMTEMLPDPVLLTTDSDFRVYRRQGRHVVPCELPD